MIGSTNVVAVRKSANRGRQPRPTKDQALHLLQNSLKVSTDTAAAAIITCKSNCKAFFKFEKNKTKLKLNVQQIVDEIEDHGDDS
jgi:hypothetical protein